MKCGIGSLLVKVNLVRDNQEMSLLLSCHCLQILLAILPFPVPCGVFHIFSYMNLARRTGIFLGIKQISFN